MSLLIPLGLLGLLGIAVLFLIYILKPNYQNKTVSSTYIWKLSIKYKKKRLPISKLRNILLIICQILVIVACAMILAKPAQILKERIDQSEVVIIIDSSASMRTTTNNESRYQRAVVQASDFADEVFSHDGIVSVIIADRAPAFLNLEPGEEASKTALRITADKKKQLRSALDELLIEETACSYGTADMDQVMVLCSDVVDQNPDASIYLYTDSDYAYVPDGISVVNVSDKSDWNASIVNAYTEFQDNHYSFVVEVASYGSRDEEIEVKLQIQGINTESKNDRVPPVNYFGSAFCTEGKVKTVIFSDRDQESLSDYEKNSEDVTFVTMDTPVISYQSVHVSLQVEDSFSADDVYDIYNGLKEVVKVQYASSLSNPFVNSALDTVRSNFAERWDMRISEVRDGNYATEGFDFYVFEHEVPETLPTDGIVLIIDPDKMPYGSMEVSGGGAEYRDPGLYLTPGEEHPVMKYVIPDFITVTRIKAITNFNSEEYKVGMYCQDLPALLIKDTQKAKIVVMPFSLHFSNFAVLPYFSIFISNMFNYFLPTMVQGSVFNVYEDIALNSRGSKIEVSYNGEVINTYDSFPAVMCPEVVGTYVLSQEKFGSNDQDENAKLEDSIYVRVPASECNILKVEESLKNPFIIRSYSDYYNDLLLYFAIALCSLLLIEWLLQMRENV